MSPTVPPGGTPQPPGVSQRLEEEQQTLPAFPSRAYHVRLTAPFLAWNPPHAEVRPCPIQASATCPKPCATTCPSTGRRSTRRRTTAPGTSTRIPTTAAATPRARR